MPGMTDYLERVLLRHVLRNTPYSPPVTLYVGLFTVDPTDAGLTTNEIAGNAYQRGAISFKDVASTGNPGPALNNVMTFPAATPSGWGTITHWALFDSQTGGQMLLYGALALSKVVGAGDTFRFPDNNMSISLD
jgi:hypothetical protein